MLRDKLKDRVFLNMARTLSELSTCPRRSVGCILVDSKYRVIGSGYNGAASGLPHCIDNPCKGASFQPGEGYEVCEAIHAEQNALLQCKDIDHIYACYTTTAPCIHCIKMLLNTTCKRIVFLDKHPHDDLSRKLWLSNNFKLWDQYYDYTL
jgi:dCMP deaminase